MTRSTATSVAQSSAPAARDLLIHRYDQVHGAWARQVAIAEVTRDGRDVGPGDDADHASTYAQVGEQVALTKALRVQLDELVTAMERSDNGTYGRCEGCGHPIPAARLALFPAATRCVACKQRLER